MQTTENALYQWASHNINAQRISQHLPPIPPTKEQFIAYFTARREQVTSRVTNSLIKTAIPLAATAFIDYQSGGNTLTNMVSWGLLCALGFEVVALIALSIMTPEGIAIHSQNMVDIGVRLNAQT